MPWSSKTFTARAEGGSHDGEEFDITEETVGLVLTSRRDPAIFEYYEFAFYMRGNLLAFIREYDADERRLAFASNRAFRAADLSADAAPHVEEPQPPI